MTDIKSNIVAVIPARGGSKGIPGKNLVDLGGQPLLAWTIRAARESGVIDRTIVSTDCEKIAQVAQDAGAEVPFLRPPVLALDDVHAVHVVLHALDWLSANEQYEPEGVMMLLPTSPLRTPEDIRGVLAKFNDNSAPAVISVVDLGKYLNNLRFLRGDHLEIAISGQNKNAQRQELEKLYSVNGSIFLARPRALRTEGTFHLSGALGYVMDVLNSIDINSSEDLLLARKISKCLAPWNQRKGVLA